MTNKLILVGISLVIGISMIVVLVNLTDDIKYSLSTTNTIHIAIDFNDGPASAAVFNEVFTDLDTIKSFNFGNVEEKEVIYYEDAGDIFTFYFDIAGNDFIVFNIFSNAVEDSSYPATLVGDGSITMTIVEEPTGILPTLIDLLPIIATLILITTAVIVIKKQN